MKTYLANYLFSRNLISGSKCDQLNEIEYFLTKENFWQKSREAYEIIFDESPEPIVFTGHKFFLTKVVDPLFARVDLMERGLHIFRMVFARHAHQLRSKGDDDIDNNGVKVFENYFDKETADQLKEEILTFPKYENIQPNNRIRDVVSETSHPALWDVVYRNKLFPHCVKAVHRSTQDMAAWDHFLLTTYVQRLENRPNDGDIQKVCHSDVFYPCMKFWYFPEDVSESDGPFMYAKGSTQMTEEQLDFFYRESIAVAEDTWDRKRNKGHGEGSFRALPEDLQQMNLNLEPITAKANSLVIADTSGFHCRGDVESTAMRNALHGAIRVETPFDA